MLREIDLSWFGGIGVIISTPSGVVYTNQTHGFACEHPSEEGVFFPLPEVTAEVRSPIVGRLEEHFRGGWHHLLESDADFIDAELRSLGFDFVQVDRARITESFEAWVRVRMQPGTDSRFSGVACGFEGSSGVLTWPNSD